jgi:hypothetical protein
MTVGGIGFSLALPAVTKPVVSLVAPQDIGRASGTCSTTRQPGCGSGVAILGAVFAATGGYDSPTAFNDGFKAATGVSAVLALLAATAGTALPRRHLAQIAAEPAPPVTAEAQ